MKQEAADHLGRAESLLALAERVLSFGYPADSISRAYYAMFHSASAVLLEMGIARGSHHGLWAAFGEHVAAKGLMDAKYHRAGLRLLRARTDSDYKPKPKDTHADAQDAIRVAQDFVAACRGFLEKGAN